MTVNISYADTGDGGVYGYGTYAEALAGTNRLTTDTDIVTFGQSYDVPITSGYVVDQAFFSFGYTLASSTEVVDAHFEFNIAELHSATVARDMEVYEYDWGGSLDTSDFRTPSQVSALTRLAVVSDIQNSYTDNLIQAGSPALTERMFTTGAIRCMVSTSRARQQSTPTVDERGSFYAANHTGTDKDPRLVWTTIPISYLARVAGAQVALSDGRTAVLEATAAETSLGTGHILLRTVDTAGAATTVSTVGTSFADSWRGGLQGMGLCRDSSDRMYVVGRAAGMATTLAVQSWSSAGTAGPVVSAPMATYDGSFDHFAVTWHATGGTYGTLVVVALSGPGTGTSPYPTNHGQVLLISCDAVVTGTGTVTRGTTALKNVISNVVNGFNGWTNSLCTGLDVAAASATVGWLVTYAAEYPPSLSRYTLASGGTSITASSTSLSLGYVTRNADSKLRVVPISDTQVMVAGGSYPFVSIQKQPGSGFVTLGRVSTTDVGAATVPVTLADTPMWDIVYDSGSNRVWWYYVDSGASHTVKRTYFDLSTMLPSGVETVVSSSVGAGGTANRAMRATRGALVGSFALLTVANNAGGTLYYPDVLNQAPLAPTLTPKANFDADAAATFMWTFNDANVGDTQSYYELDIDTAGGSGVYDSGWVSSSVGQHVLSASTLTNGSAYQWRVRTQDNFGATGAWSGFGTFSTAAGGNVTITDPASDNPAGVITSYYDVVWEVTGTVQQDYRVVLVRNDTASTISDTGWVTSTDTDITVTGMITDVEHTVSVTVRNASAVQSGTGTRLITPSFASPDIPVLILSAGEGYISVTVDNPSPSGSRPVPTSNGVYRQTYPDGGYIRLATIDPDATYLDYAAAGGVAYEYYVEAEVT